MKGLYTIVLCIVALAHNQSFSQCAPGLFSVDPASAIPLECMVPSMTSDLCEALSLQTQMTVPAGMQVCFLANGNNGAFNFSTCGRTTDDTFITLFDAFGNVITSDDNDCDEPQSLQSFISFDVSTGATVCVQVESITNGVCDGTNSTSPNYTLEIQCDVFPDNFVQVFEDANQCVIVGFNELQTIIFEDSVTDFNSFVFNTDATEQMGNFTSGSLTICAQGDIGGSENFWQIDDENGNCVGGIGNVPNGQCSDEPFCTCLLYTSPSPRDATLSRMPSSA